MSRAVLSIRVWPAYGTTRVITHVNDGINSNIHIARFVRVYSSWTLFIAAHMRSGQKMRRGAVL